LEIILSETVGIIGLKNSKVRIGSQSIVEIFPFHP